MLTPKPYSPPPPNALKIIHADPNIVVIDKPTGLLSVPGRGPEKAVCAISIVTERTGPVLTVHRLDMDTSGTMVLARSKDAQRHLSRQFELRQVSKTYEAVVQGQMQGESGTINAAIARFSKQRPLRHLDPDGRPAITHWHVLDRASGKTRVRLKPETGRSHQLRLHLASLGHPIIGDVFYGDANTRDRLHLHAKSLQIAHPETGQSMHFETDIPF